jgi:hypothetical protein
MLKYTNSLVANHFFHTIWGKKSFIKIMDIKDNMDFPYINTKYIVFLSINLWFYMEKIVNKCFLLSDKYKFGVTWES